MKTSYIPAIILLLVVFFFAYISRQNRIKNSVPDKKVGTQSLTENAYLKTYSGGYFVNPAPDASGNKTESFVLDSSGKAEWLYIENKKGQIKILSRKPGTWSASSNEIIIDIDGKSGPDKEKFRLSNGIFRNGDRNLIHSKG